MFSYRHAFHAGSHADVLKHTVLIALLEHLVAKPAPLLVIDTHAGAGLYRLDSEAAGLSGEAQDGVLKLNEAAGQTPSAIAAMESVAPALAAYLEAVRAVNRGGGLRIYPGSPFLAQRFLRKAARDKLKLFELHPTDARALAANVAQLEAGRQIAIDRADGFAALRTLLPPPARRALVLMDPSYEIKTDYAKVSACLQDALKRFATGCYAIWHPIIPRPEAHELPRRLRTIAQQAGKPWLHAQLAIGQRPSPGPALAAALAGEPARRPGLSASGVFVVNPPHTLKAALAPALVQMEAVLGRGRGRMQRLETG